MKISVRNNNGSLISRWTINGQGYTLSYGTKDLTRCELIAKSIELDIQEGCFDTTLEKYKQGGKRLIKQLAPMGEMWGQWVATLELTPTTSRAHYLPIASRIPQGAKVGSVDWIKSASEGWSSDTWNSRISRIKSFGKWLVDEGYLPANPYRSLKRRKSEREEYTPFTVEEMTAILEHIKEKRPDLERFYRFLFLTGCRPAEAIGLRWADINFLDGYITISSVLARGACGGASPAHRYRKATKTGKARRIGLSDELKSLLADCNNTHALVFTSATGKSVDDRNALNRVWKPALTALGIPYRVPYNTRHTVASQLLAQGVPAIQVAKSLGTSMKMLDQHYGHAQNDNLPMVSYTVLPVAPVNDIV